MRPYQSTIEEGRKQSLEQALAVPKKLYTGQMKK
jgi:hypothetical protein